MQDSDQDKNSQVTKGLSLTDRQKVPLEEHTVGTKGSGNGIGCWPVKQISTSFSINDADQSGFNIY